MIELEIDDNRTPVDNIFVSVIRHSPEPISNLRSDKIPPNWNEVWKKFLVEFPMTISIIERKKFDIRIRFIKQLFNTRGKYHKDISDIARAASLSAFFVEYEIYQGFEYIRKYLKGYSMNSDEYLERT